MLTKLEANKLLKSVKCDILNKKLIKNKLNKIERQILKTINKAKNEIIIKIKYNDTIKNEILRIINNNGYTVFHYYYNPIFSDMRAPAEAHKFKFIIKW